MTWFPNFAVLLKIGSFELHWYSITMFLGIASSYLITKRMLKDTCYQQSFIEDIYFGGVITGIIGARLWYVVFDPNHEYYFNEPLNIIKTWEGGLAIQGVIVAVGIYITILALRRKVNVLRILDIIAPTTLIAQGIGRWGNFFNQEAYGTIVSESFFNYLPNFIKEGMLIAGHYRMPMFFIEFCFNIIGYLLIYTVIKKYLIKKRGDYAYWYFLWTGVGRFFIEIYRTDNLMMGNFKSAQVVSILYVIFALGGLLGLYERLFKKQQPLLLFDLDGTLIDSRLTIEKSMIQLLNNHGFTKELTAEEKDSFVGPPLKDNLARYFPAEEIDDRFKEYSEINNHLIKTELQSFAGAKELLAFLKTAGYTIAIVSNRAHQSAQLALDSTGLADYIDLLVGLDDVEHPKPDKQPIVTAADKLKKGYDSLVMVGDSEDDMICAKNAGAFAIAYCSHEMRREGLKAAKPNCLIEDLSDIKEILKEEHPWTYTLT